MFNIYVYDYINYLFKNISNHSRSNVLVISDFSKTTVLFCDNDKHNVSRIASWLGISIDW